LHPRVRRRLGFLPFAGVGALSMKDDSHPCYIGAAAGISSGSFATAADA
jgi:hypothetical protein